jgi:hypothetical protein
MRKAHKGGKFVLQTTTLKQVTSCQSDQKTMSLLKINDFPQKRNLAPSVYLFEYNEIRNNKAIYACTFPSLGKIIDWF